MNGPTETQVKQYIRQFHSVHLADITRPMIKVQYSEFNE